jgi:hypothetical protein
MKAIELPKASSSEGFWQVLKTFRIIKEFGPVMA